LQINRFFFKKIVVEAASSPPTKSMKSLGIGSTCQGRIRGKVQIYGRQGGSSRTIGIGRRNINVFDPTSKVEKDARLGAVTLKKVAAMVSNNVKPWSDMKMHIRENHWQLALNVFVARPNRHDDCR